MLITVAIEPFGSDKNYGFQYDSDNKWRKIAISLIIPKDRDPESLGRFTVVDEQKANI